MGELKSLESFEPSLVKSLKIVFDMFDYNGDGSIDALELKSAMKRSIGVELSETELQDFMREFDIDGNGTIDFCEFVNLMAATKSGGGEIPTANKTTATATAARATKKSAASAANDDDDEDEKDFSTSAHSAHREISQPAASSSDEEEIRAAFKVFDMDGNGFISEDELRQTLSNLGEHLSDRELRAMMNQADLNHDGQIDYNEFSRMLLNR